MRVVLLTPSYPPESGAAANRVAALAKGLAHDDWQVTVVTLLPHYPQDRIYPGFDRPEARTRDEDGIRVLRFHPWIVPRANLLMRTLAELHFTLRAALATVRQPADLVVASSPFMFLGPFGLAAARLRRVPFAWDVRDLTWLYPRATGKRTYGLDRPIEALMRWTARNADLVTTATEGLTHYFLDRARRIETVPNGVSDEFYDRLAELPLNGTEGVPTVMYAGLFGYNHALSTVIDAASRLPGIPFVLVGDGPERPDLERKIAAMGLANVKLSGYLDHDALIDAYRHATILVSHLRANPLFAWTQPAKLWEYMAAGRPVVHAGEGEAVEILDRAGVAVTVPPEDPEAMAQAIRRLLDDPTEARAMAAEARGFVREHRRRSELVARHVRLLDALMSE